MDRPGFQPVVGDEKFLRLQVYASGQADGLDEEDGAADQNAGFQNGGATVGQDLPTENVTPVGILGEEVSAYDRDVDRARRGGDRLVLIGRVAIGRLVPTIGRLLRSL